MLLYVSALTGYSRDFGTPDAIGNYKGPNDFHKFKELILQSVTIDRCVKPVNKTTSNLIVISGQSSTREDINTGWQPPFLPLGRFSMPLQGRQAAERSPSIKNGPRPSDLLAARFFSPSCPSYSVHPADRCGSHS
jgi:hypothetical protein